jgi:hypothetical protein
MAANAIADPVALRKTHGSSTSPPSGSHTRPSVPCWASAVACPAWDGCPRLGLTPALGPGEGGALGDHGADQPGGGERVHHPLVGNAAGVGQTGEDRREDARATGGRRCHDHPHGRVHLLNGQRPGEDVAEDGTGQGTRGPLAKLRGVPTDEAGSGPQVSDEPLPHCPAHDRQRTTERAANLGDRAPLVLRLRLERNPGERRSL